MRVAVSSDDKKSMSYQLCNASGFVIYDISEGEIKNHFYRCFSTPEYRKDSRELKKLEQNSHRIIEALLDCDAVISFEIDKKLQSELNRAGIEVFQSNETNVDNALNVFIGKKLEVLN
jgi:predicted Fe-Mo cluster-binding NifX family protein